MVSKLCAGVIYEIEKILSLEIFNKIVMDVGYGHTHLN